MLRSRVSRSRWRAALVGSLVPDETSGFDLKKRHVLKAKGDRVVVMSRRTEFVGCKVSGEADMDDAGCRVAVADGSCSEQHLGGGCAVDEDHDVVNLATSAQADEFALAGGSNQFERAPVHGNRWLVSV